MNLQHWVDNMCRLAQCETAYLAYTKDLMTILSTQDDAVARLAPLMESILLSLYKIVGKVSNVTLSESNGGSVLITDSVDATYHAILTYPYSR